MRIANKRSDFMDVYIQQSAYKNLKQRETIAMKALEDLDKHYNIVCGSSTFPTTAWHIVIKALERVKRVGNE